MGGLELDEDQRQAVDEADQVGAALVHVAGDPELRGQQEVVVGRVLPVDDAHQLGPFVVVSARQRDLDAVLEQVVDLVVGAAMLMALRSRVSSSMARSMASAGVRVEPSKAGRSRRPRTTSLRFSRPSVPLEP